MIKTMMKNILLLICSVCFCPTSVTAQKIQPVNVVVNEFIADEQGRNGVDRLLYSEMVFQLSEMSNLYNIVERVHYDDLMKERSGASSIKDDSYASSILSGASLLVEFDIVNYEESWDSTKILVGDSPLKPYNYRLTLYLTYQLKVTDLATSEVLGLVELEARGNPGEIQEKDTEAEKYELRKSCRFHLRRAIWNLNQRHLLQIIKPRIPIIKVEGKNKAEAVFILGGKRANLPLGIDLRVVEESSVKIGGEEVMRQATIGLVTTGRSKWRDVTRCSVKSNAKEIQHAWSAGKATYLLLGEDVMFPLSWNSSPNKQ